MKTLGKIITLGLATSSVLVASGWRIPEQSMASMATSGAYVAHAKGADAAYFNPANMSFDKDKYQFEADLTYIHLGGIEYRDNQDATKNATSKSENFLLPTLFLSSKEYNGWRFGGSVVIPGGLSKRWDNPYQQAFAKEFTLEIVEINPVVSYAISSNLAVGGGIRIIYSNGIVKNDLVGVGADAQREMEGETWEFGYNLALAYKPTKTSNLSITYRSNIDLKEEGNAKIYLNGLKTYDGGANVTVPLPAVLALAASYEFETKTTVEVEYDRTFWSEYEKLDFNYKSPIPSLLVPYFDEAKIKNWDDSDAFRISVTQEIERYTLMAGFAYDKTPVPSDKVSFELPDSDAYIFSLGAQYAIDEAQKVGFGYLYDLKKDRDVVNSDGGVNGKFSNISAHLLSVGYSVEF